MSSYVLDVFCFPYLKRGGPLFAVGAIMEAALVDETRIAGYQIKTMVTSCGIRRICCRGAMTYTI